MLLATKPALEPAVLGLLHVQYELLWIGTGEPGFVGSCFNLVNWEWGRGETIVQLVAAAGWGGGCSHHSTYQEHRAGQEPEAGYELCRPASATKTLSPKDHSLPK